jgi:hypothetical protein
MRVCQLQRASRSPLLVRGLHHTLPQAHPSGRHPTRESCHVVSQQLVGRRSCAAAGRRPPPSGRPSPTCALRLSPCSPPPRPQSAQPPPFHAHPGRRRRHQQLRQHRRRLLRAAAAASLSENADCPRMSLPAYNIQTAAAKVYAFQRNSTRHQPATLVSCELQGGMTLTRIPGLPANLVVISRVMSECVAKGGGSHSVDATCTGGGHG